MRIIVACLAVLGFIVSLFVDFTSAAPTHTPLLPPSYPLMVRNPYFSGL